VRWAMVARAGGARSCDRPDGLLPSSARASLCEHMFDLVPSSSRYLEASL
jgi:hypothetical protein